MKVQGKLFYKWFERYYCEVEKTKRVYDRNLMRKALAVLNLKRRKAMLQASKAI